MQDEAIISIQDNGCGISEDNLARIFDMLFTTKDPGRGTGHGLSLCNAIIERGHDGRIEVTSTLGEGACFSIALPLQVTAQNEVSSAQATPQEALAIAS